MFNRKEKESETPDLGGLAQAGTTAVQAAPVAESEPASPKSSQKLKTPAELMTPEAQAYTNQLVTNAVKEIFAQMAPLLQSIALTPEKLAEAEKLRRAPTEDELAKKLREAREKKLMIAEQRKTDKIWQGIKVYAHTVIQPGCGPSMSLTIFQTASQDSSAHSVNPFLNPGDGLSEHPTRRTRVDALISPKHTKITRGCPKCLRRRESNDHGIPHEIARSYDLQDHRPATADREKQPTHFARCQPNIGARKRAKTDVALRKECSRTSGG